MGIYSPCYVDVNGCVSTVVSVSCPECGISQTPWNYCPNCGHEWLHKKMVRLRWTSIGNHTVTIDNEQDINED